MKLMAVPVLADLWSDVLVTLSSDSLTHLVERSAVTTMDAVAPLAPQAPFAHALLSLHLQARHVSSMLFARVAGRQSLAPAEFR